MNEIRALFETAAGDGPAEGRVAAFGEIVRRFQDMAYGCAYAILGDFHLAEDAAQEAFVTAYRELPRLRRAEAFPAWLRRIVVSRCSRMVRARRPATTGLAAAAEVASPRPGPADLAEARELSEMVLAVVRALPEAQRMATALYYIDGYSQKEIAAFMDVPVGTVKKRLSDARGRLRERMIGMVRERERTMKMVEETMKSFPLPGDFADVVVRKVAGEADLKGAAGMLSYSARKRPRDFQTPAGADAAGIYVVGEPGAVEGAGYFNETELSIGSTVLRAAQPDEMGAESEGVPHPAFVRGFQACFKLAAEAGIHLAVVHGSQFDHAFCGFVPCFYYPVATLPVKAAQAIVSRADVSEADEKQRHLARQAYLSDPYAPKISAFIGGGVPHVITQAGRTVGYVTVDEHFDPGKKFDMPFGYVTDLTVRTREAALAALRLAGRLVAADGGDQVCLMQSHVTLVTRTMLSLGGTYLLRGPCDLPGLDAEMVAIIDLPGLTRDLEGEFQRRLSASPAGDVDAALSVEMQGAVVGFAARGGRLEIVAERQHVHRPLPRWVVTRLYVGFYSGADVLAMGPIPADRSDGRTPDDPAMDNRRLKLPGPEAALLEALFPRLWPVAWPDPDVWPWVIGKPHPRYQNEGGKSAEMKARSDALRFPWLGR